MMKRKREWCHTERQQIDYLGFVKSVRYGKLYTGRPKYKKRHRCPYCNRLLEVLILECHDPGCWHVYLPPHKGKYKRTPVKVNHDTRLVTAKVENR